MNGTDPGRVRDDQRRVERDFWPKLRRNIRRLPFVEEAIAAYYCALDPATPVKAKAVLLGALAYFILPSDVLPDFLAVVGFTDDAAVLYAAVRSVTPHISEDHRVRARAVLGRLSGETQPA